MRTASGSSMEIAATDMLNSIVSEGICKVDVQTLSPSGVRVGSVALRIRRFFLSFSGSTMTERVNSRNSA